MMRTWRWGIAAGAIAAAVLGVASCGDDNGGGGGGGAAPPQLSPDPLKIEIQSATLPESGRPTVRFRVLDGAGNPIDLEAEMATTTTFPRSAAPRFTLAMLDDNNDYRSYYEITAQPQDYTFDGPKPIPAPRTQATAQTASAANLTAVGGGVFEFTFPTPTVTTGLDRTKTHTVGAFTTRNTSAADTDAAFATFNFVPVGGTPRTYAVASDASNSCGRCHAFVQAHGSRRGVPLCITCHSPQTGDPETDRTVNFKVMIHKIHSGETLPSVENGTPYFIVGFRQSVHDWSDLAFPWHDHGVQHCTVCHAGSPNSDVWRTRPTFTACTSCHDNVQFSGTDPNCGGNAIDFPSCLHSGGTITITDPNSDTACLGCHGPTAAFAIDNFHHGD